jgi:hypothetical protein
MQVTTYATRDQAEAALMAAGLKKIGPNCYAPDGIWYLRHGEYSAPDYSIRKVAGGWAIHRKVYFYRGSRNAPKSGYVDMM